MDVTMGDGTAAITAAAIGAAVGIPGATGAGVIAYRAGRKQVADQGVVDHRHVGITGSTRTSVSWP
ncbi:hypothetical protein [Streptomyces sp. NPDC058142]|uniref:hypothetical protein n=1 Tax=Streptomyces sp. NPDC058142 TaxID=3346355 RepID=UPI0036EB8D03